MATNSEPFSIRTISSPEDSVDIYAWLFESKYIGKTSKCFNDQYHNEAQQRIDSLTIDIPDSQKTSTYTDNQEMVMKNENFLQMIKKWFNDEETSDLKLKVGKQIFFCHKLIITQQSPYIKALIKDENTKGSTELVLEELFEDVFEGFLIFFYTGEIKVNKISVVPLLVLARKYQVVTLQSLCMFYMIQNAKYLAVYEAINWCLLTYSLSLEPYSTPLVHVFFACQRNIVLNVEKLVNSDDWLKLDFLFVMDLLNSLDMVINSEFALLKAIVNWLNTKHEEQMIDHGEKMLQLIRYQFLKPTEMASVENMFSDNQLKKLVKGLINQACGSLIMYPHQDLDDFEDYLMPRNYLSDTFHKMSVLDILENSGSTPILVKSPVLSPLVPKASTEAEWKLICNISDETLSLELYLESALLVFKDLKIKAAVLITNKDGQVMQVEETWADVTAHKTLLGCVSEVKC